MQLSSTLDADDRRLSWPASGSMIGEEAATRRNVRHPLDWGMRNSDVKASDWTADDGDPDAALLVAFAEGDGEAARQLALRLTPMILTLAVRMLGNPAEAEEIAQEAMMRLWQTASGWRPGEARVTTWIYQVGVNLCTDRLRRRRSTIDVDGLIDLADTAPAAPDRMLAEARHRALSDALARLPARQAAAVSLRHLEGLSNPEIAKIMDIGVEAVESLVARGKRALSALLGNRRAELGYQDD